MKKASSAEPTPSVSREVAAAGGSALSLWLWVAAGFVFLGILWTGMFIAARMADTRTVPLATQEAKP